jgi:peptidoglycan hydrolase-like protein with peptidoglycan-binding domain
MISSCLRGVVTGVVVLSLASPVLAASETKTGTMKQEKTDTKAMTKEVQQALKEKGDDPGTIDGIMGRKTRAAIRKFQKTNGIEVTGTVDKQTAEKLGLPEEAKK